MEAQRKTYWSVVGRRLRVWLCLFAMVAAAAVWGVVEGALLFYNRHELHFADLPEKYDGMTVVYASDFHFDAFASSKRLERMVEKINSFSPDLILLGGDYANIRSVYFVECVNILSRLHAKHGVWAVPGNHDWRNMPVLRAAMKQAGIGLLENDGVWLGEGKDRWRLAGTADYWSGTLALQPALGGARPKDFVLLLQHNPDYAEALPAGAADLMLSGHTHAGQATFFGLWSPFLFVPTRHGEKYRAGLVDDGGTKVYVSSGVGGLIFPLRYCAPPTVEVFTLRSGG